MDQLFEPFCGSAALTLYAAQYGLAKSFVIGDACEPVVELWKAMVTNPSKVSDGYRKIWSGQDGSLEYFNQIRDEFNRSRNPTQFLFLAARCVANAIRFNAKGNFTQSQDKRRLGTQPDRMALEIERASGLLRGRVTFFCGDFRDCIADAGPTDLVYMDPPYQGTTEGRDSRYFSGLERSRLEAALADLNARSIRFLLSYDGMHGEKRYGEDLPATLNVQKLLIETGRSTQGTLHGREVMTKEGLYVSAGLAPTFQPCRFRARRGAGWCRSVLRRRACR